MKLKQVLLFFILFKYIINGENKVINSCGADEYKLNYKEPENETFCKDRDNGFCKFVHITHNDGSKTKYCAVVHGNYNDKSVLDDVVKLINVSSIEVLESKYLIGNKSGIFYLFFFILIFLL